MSGKCKSNLTKTNVHDIFLEVGKKVLGGGVKKNSPPLQNPYLRPWELRSKKLKISRALRELSRNCKNALPRLHDYIEKYFTYLLQKNDSLEKDWRSSLIVEFISGNPLSTQFSNLMI